MRLTLLLVFIVISQQIIGQTFNRPTPPDVFPYEFQQFDTGNHGYYFTAPFRLWSMPGDPDYISSKPMILDENGYLLWYLPTSSRFIGDFKYFPDHQRFSYINTVVPGTTNYPILDENFQFVDTVTNFNMDPDGHEIQILPNGHYVIGGLVDSIADLSAFMFDGVQGDAATVMVGYGIQEFDANNNLVFEWNSNDVIAPTDAYDLYGYNPSDFDYFHGNAIEEDTDGNFLVSGRSVNAIYKINKSTGLVMWKLGGKNSSFTFPNDAGFSGQHDIRRLPNGNISLYDNANSNPLYSRAVEYSLDTVNWTATKVWEYVHSPSFFARAMGNHQTTAANYHLINYGFTFRPNPSVVLVDNNNIPVSAILFPDTVMSYRSFIFELPFTIDRPEITCTPNGAGSLLSAPSGFSDYVWSTGETTQNISISTPGTYQVWVNLGEGMVGSEPVLVDALTLSCSLLNTELVDPSEPKIVKAVYDILGRKINQTESGKLYIIEYENGTWEQRIFGH